MVGFIRNPIKAKSPEEILDTKDLIDEFQEQVRIHKMTENKDWLMQYLHSMNFLMTKLEK